MIFQTQICGDIEVKMNKKNFMDMMICSLSAAIIILCFTYMEQSRGCLLYTSAEKKVIGKKAQIIVVTELILGMVFLAVNQRAAYAVLGACLLYTSSLRCLL